MDIKNKLSIVRNSKIFFPGLKDRFLGRKTSKKKKKRGLKIRNKFHDSKD
jgi:hypothetical protein